MSAAVSSLIDRTAPTLFVLIWSTGFIVAGAVRPTADPNLFLVVRFSLTALLFVAVAAAHGAAWLPPRAAALHVLAGTLVPGAYLSLGYWAVANGMTIGIMTLIAGLSPLLVGVLSRLTIAERLAWTGWAGLVIGFAGVALVLQPELAAGPATGGLGVLVLVASAGSVLALAAGTVVQKTTIARADLRVTMVLQNLGAVIVCGAMTLLLGERSWDWGAWDLWASLAWAVIGLSAAGQTLLIFLARRGAATKAAALMLLLPPLTAVEAWLLFGETLTLIQVAGFAVALAGVLLARRRG